MSLRTKITIGLGFLFLIIFALAIYSSFEIQGLSSDASKIIKDNYDSLVYCKKMLIALDDMRTAVGTKFFGINKLKLSDYYSNLFETSKSTFEINLRNEKGNITEIGEKTNVEELSNSYSLFLNLGMRLIGKKGTADLFLGDFLTAYRDVRQSVDTIDDLNMQAIERKSQLTQQNARNMINAMAAVGAICVLLAFFYFRYFPFYISNTTAYLSKKMKELLASNGIKFESKTKDEAFVLLQSINLLDERLSKEKALEEMNPVSGSRNCT